ncbi:MAG: polysaccharide deacetylase family protein [Hyphomonadaceae bacterium]
MTVSAYAPPRDALSKVRRRVTQMRRARPARLAFEAPLLSICFDDFPASAAENGAAILERHGARGTFYAAAGLAGELGPSGVNFSGVDLQRLAKAGHEIGCHTYGHADCARRDAFDTLKDLARNREALAALGYRGEVRSLAYPYGETRAALKRALPPRFASARGVTPGLNSGAVDLAHLRACPLYETTLPQAHAWLKRAAKRKAWMIAYTHDVADPASLWGVRPENLDAFLRAARGAGVRILPVTRVLIEAGLCPPSAS